MDFVLRSIPVLLRTGSIGWASTSPICFKFHDSPTLDDPQVSEGCEPVKSRCVLKKSEFLTGGSWISKLVPLTQCRTPNRRLAFPPLK